MKKGLDMKDMNVLEHGPCFKPILQSLNIVDVFELPARLGAPGSCWAGTSCLADWGGSQGSSGRGGLR